jgi:hypothetical protein
MHTSSTLQDIGCEFCPLRRLFTWIIHPPIRELCDFSSTIRENYLIFHPSTKRVTLLLSNL